MGMVEHKEFKTASEIYANAAAVRERMLRPKKSGPTEEDILKAKVAKLEAKIEEQNAKLAKNEKMIERLLMDKSDLHGAILSQAHMLIDTFRASSAESEKVTRRSPRQIIEYVLAQDYPNVSFSDIVGPRRTKELIEPRHKCMAAVYTERKDLSLPQIARVFHRDHTVILYAANKLDKKR
jgi:chromosomal replication initiator protein